MSPKLDVDEPKRRIAVLTSGGDSAGMNAAVRAVVRMGIKRGCEMYVVREGWEGLVRGNTVEGPHAQSSRARPTGKFEYTFGEGELLKEGEAEQALKGRHIIRVGWDDVRGWASEGGTLIGTARSKAFRELEGRRKAAHNLLKHGIDALVVCGGDGSLTGADKLRGEWSEHVQALLKSGDINDATAKANAHLNIVGRERVLVGCLSFAQIDNDMAGTDLTIGASTALHRICEAVDSINSTASSHSRAFVVEVMGRHCGWLALMAGISCGADYIFVPERPPLTDDWETEMCNVLQKHREVGKRKSIVIVAEGAIDKKLNPINAEHVKTILSERLKLDTRVTTLGHTQRGGRPCAYDRVLATLQGVDAIEAVLAATPDTPSPVIGLFENQITRRPLVDSVKLTQSVAAAIEARDFVKAISLRDPEFEECLIAFGATTYIDETLRLPEDKRMRVGIMHLGAPAGGMNAATRAAVRFCIARGHTPVAIYNSIPGLLNNSVMELSWLRVDQWMTRGGSEIGTNRRQPSENMEGVAARLAEHNIQSLLIIGGFEAFTAMQQLKAARPHYKALRIPLVHLPATISNNVPGTDFSLGADTSVNVLTDHCDSIKQSASASRARVFVVETQGGDCGYIAVVGALAAGAVVAYIPEYGISLDQLKSDVDFLKSRYESDARGKSEGRLVIRSERSSRVYTTEVITNILLEEGGKLFDSRSVNLGHTLQGGVPTPRDRTRAVRLAVRCIEFLERQAVNVKNDERLMTRHTAAESAPPQADPNEPDAAVIGIQGASIRVVGLEEVEASADMKRRRSKKPWWLPLMKLVDILGGREDLSAAPVHPRAGIHSLVKDTVREFREEQSVPGIDD